MGVTAFAQTSTTPTQTPDQSAARCFVQQMNPMTSRPMQRASRCRTQSKEGFWGHMNPLARKKWVHRQVDPIKDQVNELDQLQAKNANDISDVDARAQAGINKAMNAANTADQHAQDASNRANAAKQLASNASTRTDALNTTVSNLDQYQTVSSTSVKFAAGRTTLGPTGKSDLDALATTLAGEKGYIIEVQGYSQVWRSDLAGDGRLGGSLPRNRAPDSGVPDLRTGLGKNTTETADGEQAITNGVRVTLLHNSLATMGGNTASNSTPKTSRTGASPQEVNQ